SLANKIHYGDARQCPPQTLRGSHISLENLHVSQSFDGSRPGSIANQGSDRYPPSSNSRTTVDPLRPAAPVTSITSTSVHGIGTPRIAGNHRKIRAFLFPESFRSLETSTCH